MSSKTANVQPAGGLAGRSRQSDLSLARRAGLRRSDLEAVVASGVFDGRFYLMTYPDVAKAKLDPLEHYLVSGRFEKRQASAIFDPVAYVEANPEVATSGMEPFLHYVLIGQPAGAPLNRLVKRVGLSASDLNAVVASGVFDERFYLMTYPDVAETAADPFEHYLVFGRFEKRKASATFDPVAYVETNPEVAISGMEPFLHHVLIGRTIGAPSDGLARRVGLSPGYLDAVAASGVFDERFYLMTYPDVTEAALEPFEHYLVFGRFEKRRASAIFDPVAYDEANPAVAVSGMEPFLHYALVGQTGRAPLSKAETITPRPALTHEIATGTRRLIVFLTPGHDARLGGVLSISAIYEESKGLADLHGAKVALCAIPGDDALFLKYSWFENDNYLLDLNTVLRRCENLDYLQLHIPEYVVNRMSKWLDEVSSSLLKNIPNIHLNVMLQNIDLIEGQNIADLKRFGQVTITTAHEAYSNSATREALGVTVHKLSVRIGPERYKRATYAEKEQILVVSHDDHPLKEKVLQLIARAHPQLEIRIVHDLSFEEYKALILRAKWALTFGEGLDGYFAETVFSGGNSFAVFNDRFFTPAFAQLETVYPSWESLQGMMPVDLQRLDEPLAYERCWREAYALLSGLYGTDQFRHNLRAFYRGEYTFP